MRAIFYVLLRRLLLVDLSGFPPHALQGARRRAHLVCCGHVRDGHSNELMAIFQRPFRHHEGFYSWRTLLVAPRHSDVLMFHCVMMCRDDTMEQLCQFWFATLAGGEAPAEKLPSTLAGSECCD